MRWGHVILDRRQRIVIELCIICQQWPLLGFRAVPQGEGMPPMSSPLVCVQHFQSPGMHAESKFEVEIHQILQLRKYVQAKECCVDKTFHLPPAPTPNWVICRDHTDRPKSKGFVTKVQ